MFRGRRERKPRGAIERPATGLAHPHFVAAGTITILSQRTRCLAFPVDPPALCPYSLGLEVADISRCRRGSPRVYGGRLAEASQ